MSGQRRIAIIFLNDQDKASELAAHLDDAEHAAHLVQNTDEFYHVVHSESVDLIIVDNQLPGFLSGIELIERLDKDLLRPTTILIAVPNPKLNDHIRTLSVVTLVSPTVSVAEIAATARKAMIAETIGQVPINPKARMLVQQADFIRPLPQLAVKYASRLSDASCPIEELARDVLVDPKLTALLLKLTNSASCGARIKVTRAFDAVTLLGIRRTISLIMSSSFSDAQGGLVTTLPQALQKWYFDRSVLTAGAAAAFARRTGDKNADTACVLGLLQDIGILIFAYRYHTYPDLIDRVRRVGQLRLEVAEQQEFGFTHADVSAALLSKWELPQSLIKPIAHHHRSDGESQMSNTETQFLQLIRAGEAFANLADNRTAIRSQLLNQSVAQLGMSSADEIKLCMAEAVAKAVESAKMLSIPTSDEATLRRFVA
jgi:HD-like signal output (HDOD) protein